MTKKLNNETFTTEVLNAPNTVLVDFYADWCGPCKMLSPVIDEIANEHPEFSVCKLNVDEGSAIAERYNVFSIPTLIVFQNGKEISRMVGVQPKSRILGELSK